MADLSKNEKEDSKVVEIINGMTDTDAIVEYTKGDGRTLVKKARKDRVLHLKGLDNTSFKGSKLEGTKDGVKQGLTIADTLDDHRKKGMKV